MTLASQGGKLMVQRTQGSRTTAVSSQSVRRLSWCWMTTSLLPLLGSPPLPPPQPRRQSQKRTRILCCKSGCCLCFQQLWLWLEGYNQDSESVVMHMLMKMRILSKISTSKRLPCFVNFLPKVYWCLVWV